MQESFEGGLHAASIKEKLEEVSRLYAPAVPDKDGFPAGIFDYSRALNAPELTAAIASTLEQHSQFLVLICKDFCAKKYDVSLSTCDGQRFILWTLTLSTTDIIDHTKVIPYGCIDFAESIIVDHVCLVDANFGYFAKRVVGSFFENGASEQALDNIKNLFTPTLTTTEQIDIGDVKFSTTTFENYLALGGPQIEDSGTLEQARKFATSIKDVHCSFVGDRLMIHGVFVDTITTYAFDRHTQLFDLKSTTTRVRAGIFRLTPEALAIATMNQTSDQVLLYFTLFNNYREPLADVCVPQRALHFNVFHYLTNEEERTRVDFEFESMMKKAVEDIIKAKGSNRLFGKNYLSTYYTIFPLREKRQSDDRDNENTEKKMYYSVDDTDSDDSDRSVLVQSDY